MPSSIQLPIPSGSTSSLYDSIRQRRSCRRFSDEEVSLQELSDILWAAFGFRKEDRRTAPSSHNSQETDIYVCLRQGTYLYDPKDNLLMEIEGAGDIRRLTGTQDFVAAAPVNLVYVADCSKLCGKQGRGVVETIYVDTGFIAENVYLQCASSSLACVVRALIDKPALASALHLREGQEITLAHSIGRFEPRQQ